MEARQKQCPLSSEKFAIKGGIDLGHETLPCGHFILSGGTDFERVTIDLLPDNFDGFKGAITITAEVT